MNKRFGFGVTAFYYIYNPLPKHYSSKTVDTQTLLIRIFKSYPTDMQWDAVIT